MNKKVVLSVLATAVVASMAASAFAAPKTGLYIGGNVKKFYSNNTLINMTKDARATYQKELKTAGFQNLVFVNIKGQGATIKEMFDLGTKVALADPLKPSDFLDSYGVVQNDGTVSGTEEPGKHVDPVPTGDLKVESVSAINAKQLVVKFGTAVDEDTVLDTAGALKANVFKSNGTGLTGTGEFSADSKTLTITLTGTSEGTYLFSVAKDTVKSSTGAFIAEYNEKVSYTDSVAPTLVGTETVNASTVKVNFSEPVKSFGTISAKLADGTDLSTLVTAGASIDGNSVKFNLSNAGIPSGKAISVTFVGVTDYSDNLVSPNPVTTSFTKGTNDGVAPTVTAVTPVNAKKFELKLSEQVEGLTVDDIEVNGAALVAGTDKLTQDTTDKTKYVVELSAGKQGLVTVAIAANKFTDLSGEQNAAFSKIVNFTSDSVLPTLASTSVAKKDGKEVLTLTFSEDVTVNAGAVSATAKKVVDFVTSNTTLSFNASDVKAVAGSSKEFTIELNKVTEPASAPLVQGASYTVDLPLNFVTDTAGNQNVAATAAFTFTRGTDADTKAPALDTTFDAAEVGNNIASNGVLVVDTNTLQVKFDKAVDGASATNAANYKVTGATVASATLTAGNVVELKLAADSNSYTGLRSVEVSGVKSKDGVAMTTHSTQEYLKENVRPTVSSVAVTSITPDDPATTPADESASVVTLTFSEDVVAGADDAADFDLYVKGVKVSGTTITTAVGGAKEIVVTIAGKALSEQDFANGVTLKAKATADIADANGNKANITTAIPVNL